MIITRLIGGIGNQMFQYAIARNLAIINNTEFKLDLTAFQKYNLRSYQLNNFNISESIATNDDLQKVRMNKGKILHVYNLLAFFLSPNTSSRIHVYKEKKIYTFDSKVSKIKKNLYLIGYWQSEKYFKNIEDIIKNDFIVKTQPDKNNETLLSEIKKTNSIAIHIRRGDYVNNQKTNSVHGVCDLDYYRKCIDFITMKIKKPTFFVFSDDPIWSKENVKIPFPTTYVSNNDPDKGYEDLRLMKECKHFIIANSSFSWWGAWLSTNPEKVVLAPKRWITDESKDIKDLFPESWNLM